MYQKIKPYVKIARLDHWIKQLFILPGVILAYVIIGKSEIGLDSFSVALMLVLVLFATSFVASANYVINEWLDAKFDKFHPVKKYRPLVKGNLKPWIILTEYLIFSIFGLGIGWFISRATFFSLLILWIMGMVYNIRPLRTKDVPYLDVLSESINNALRLLIGWFALAHTLLPPNQEYLVTGWQEPS